MLQVLFYRHHFKHQNSWFFLLLLRAFLLVSYYAMALKN